MEFVINYQSKGQWHFVDPVSGAHFGSKPTDEFDPSPEEGAWLLVNEKQRVYAMVCSTSGMLIELKHRNWCFFTRQKLSFKYVAPTKSAELSGTYMWKYDKKTKKYLLTNKRDPLRRVFAALALDTDFPTRMPGKMQIFDKAKVFAPDHALLSMDNEFALKELDKFIKLSILVILLQEEREMSRCRWGYKDDTADWAAQTTRMKCECLCHCFPGECILTRFEEKLKDMSSVTVQEVESEKEELSA